MRAAQLDDVAGVYEALWRVSQGSMGPRQADELEIWEVAILLGVHRTEEDDDKPAKPKSAADHRRELLRQRWAHHKGEGPAPEPKPMSAEELAQITKALNT